MNSIWLGNFNIAIEYDLNTETMTVFEACGDTVCLLTKAHTQNYIMLCMLFKSFKMCSSFVMLPKL